MRGHAAQDADQDGYESAQIGLVEFVKEKRLTKPMRGHLGKNNLPPVKFIREVPVEVDEAPRGRGTNGAMKVGDRVLVDIFDGEKFVDIVGVSKGRGFRGRGEAASLCRWSEVARFDVPDYRFDRFVGVSVARV